MLYSLLIRRVLLAQYATQGRSLLLILEYIDERSNMRRDLHLKLVTSLESLLRRLAHAYSGGRTGDDDCSCW